MRNSKKALLLLLASSFYNCAFADDKQNYQIEVIDSKGVTVQKHNLSYINHVPFIASSSYQNNNNVQSSNANSFIKYIDLCLEENNKTEYSYKNFDTSLLKHQVATKLVDTNNNVGLEDQIIEVKFSVVDFQSIDIGNCAIQKPIVYNFNLHTNFPLILLEKRYKLTDDNGNKLLAPYTVVLKKK